jgi:hypothetical protein
MWWKKLKEFGVFVSEPENGILWEEDCGSNTGQTLKYLESEKGYLIFWSDTSNTLYGDTRVIIDVEYGISSLPLDSVPYDKREEILEKTEKSPYKFVLNGRKDRPLTFIRKVKSEEDCVRSLFERVRIVLKTLQSLKH